jgi:hypothetical protein
LLLLSRFKQQVQHDIGGLANCTCLETIERSVRPPDANSFQFLDRVRLEVTAAGDKELLTWPGGTHFEDWAVTAFVKSGLVATGLFGSYAQNLFAGGGAVFKYVGPEESEGRHTVRYDFRVPLLSSAYRLRTSAGAAVLPTKGSFWFDADSLQLIRLDQFADEIPAGLGLTGALTRIHFARLPNDMLIPQTAEIELTHSSGEVRRNKIDFAQCREYRAESSINFGTADVNAEASKSETAQVDLPAGLKIKMELESGLDSATAAIGDAVRAVLIEDVRRNGIKIVPKGALVTGRVRNMDRQARVRGFVVGIEWNELRWANNRAPFHGELLEASAGEQTKRTGEKEAGANVVPLAGEAPSLEIADNSGASRRVASRVPGVGMIFLKGEQWRLAPGLSMVWLTAAP